MSDQAASPDNADHCPVCGAVIDTRATAIAMVLPGGNFVSFKSAACVKLYQADPEKFANGPAAECPADG